MPALNLFSPPPAQRLETGSTLRALRVRAGCSNDSPAAHEADAIMSRRLAAPVATQPEEEDLRDHPAGLHDAGDARGCMGQPGDEERAQDPDTGRRVRRAEVRRGLPIVRLKIEVDMSTLCSILAAPLRVS